MPPAVVYGGAYGYGYDYGYSYSYEAAPSYGMYYGTGTYGEYGSVYGGEYSGTYGGEYSGTYGGEYSGTYGGSSGYYATPGGGSGYYAAPGSYGTPSSPGYYTSPGGYSSPPGTYSSYGGKSYGGLSYGYSAAYGGASYGYTAGYGAYPIKGRYTCTHFDAPRGYGYGGYSPYGGGDYGYYLGMYSGSFGYTIPPPSPPPPSPPPPGFPSTPFPAGYGDIGGYSDGEYNLGYDYGTYGEAPGYFSYGGGDYGYGSLPDGGYPPIGSYTALPLPSPSPSPSPAPPGGWSPPPPSPSPHPSPAPPGGWSPPPPSPVKTMSPPPVLTSENSSPPPPVEAPAEPDSVSPPPPSPNPKRDASIGGDVSLAATPAQITPKVEDDMSGAFSDAMKVDINGKTVQPDPKTDFTWTVKPAKARRQLLSADDSHNGRQLMQASTVDVAYDIAIADAATASAMLSSLIAAINSGALARAISAATGLTVLSLSIPTLTANGVVVPGASSFPPPSPAPVAAPSDDGPNIGLIVGVVVGVSVVVIIIVVGLVIWWRKRARNAKVEDRGAKSVDDAPASGPPQSQPVSESRQTRAPAQIAPDTSHPAT